MKGQYIFVLLMMMFSVLAGTALADEEGPLPATCEAGWDLPEDQCEEVLVPCHKLTVKAVDDQGKLDDNTVMAQLYSKEQDFGVIYSGLDNFTDSIEVSQAGAFDFEVKSDQCRQGVRLKSAVQEVAQPAQSNGGAPHPPGLPFRSTPSSAPTAVASVTITDQATDDWSEYSITNNRLTFIRPVTIEVTRIGPAQ